MDTAILCFTSVVLGLLLGSLYLLHLDRKDRLQQLADIAKVKKDFTDMLETAVNANNSHAKEIMRLADQVTAHEFQLKGSRK